MRCPSLGARLGPRRHPYRHNRFVSGNAEPVTAAVLLLTSCAGDTSTTTIEAQPDSSATTAQTVQSTSAQAQAPTETTEAVPEDIPECVDSVEEIALGATVSSEVAEGEDVYFCVYIPQGVDSFVVSISGLTEDLDLYVGYPDLEMVQEGGIGLKFSTDRDTEDEVVTFGDVRFASDWYWGPGSYYIEVSALRSSTFSLTVTTP